jgi:hypothetical protein
VLSLRWLRISEAFGKTRVRLSTLLITMGIFSSLFPFEQDGGEGRFQTEEAYAQNRTRQLGMTPQKVAHLRKFGITDQSQLELKYFFYTNTKEKAAALAQKLIGMGYTGFFDHSAYFLLNTKKNAAALAQKLTDMGYTGSLDHSASDKRQFVVAGLTSRMNMDYQTVLAWTERMCDVGREHDCESDGWFPKKL